MTKSMSQGSAWSWIVGLTLLIGLSVQAIPQTDVSETLIEKLDQRVQERWQSLIKHDYKIAYQYQSPAYREVYSADYYANQFGDQARWLSAEVVDIELSDDVGANTDEDFGSPVAVVKVLLQYQVPFPSEQEPTKLNDTLSEKWLFKEGQWWHVN